MAVLYWSIDYTHSEPRDHTTLNHETMHGFALMHTHKDGPVEKPVQKYVFDTYTTDNVMSYSSEAKTLWQWQRQFIKTKKI